MNLAQSLYNDLKAYVSTTNEVLSTEQERNIKSYNYNCDR